MSEFKFSQLGLASILSQNRLVVPPNQRNYSWTSDEVTTLLQDFARSIESREAAYFVGTIVVIRKDDDVLEVVDGQQRLATTAILLAEIRSYLQECNEPRLCEAIHRFLFTIDRKTREDVPRLTLNLDDNDYFRTGLTGESLPSSTVKPSHCLLKSAFTQISEQVKKIVSIFDKKDHGDKLNDWITFFENRAMTVVLEAPSEADAYRMFETLNDHGLRITQADLVKNYLFGRSSDRINEVKHRWSEM